MIPRATPSDVDEASLIREIRNGRTEFFEHFVRRYQRRVTRIAYRFLRDAAEADCAAQESFLRAYQNLGDFREGAAFETWLTRICINWCKDRLKRRRRVVVVHEAPGRQEDDGGDPPEERAPSRDPSPERRAAGREIRERLAAALETLSPRQRVVFALKHFEEMSIPDIAATTGLDEGTIKSHLFRAARKIRERLAEFQS